MARIETGESPSGCANAPAPDVSVLVVSYNTREMTLEAIRSAQAQTQTTSLEVIVVDNNSTDGSADAIAHAFPAIRLIRCDRNLGFGAANNLASSRARGHRLLLLNPDTVITDRAIDRIVDFADAHPEAGIWGGRTLFSDGRLNTTNCWGRMTAWNQFCRTAGLTSLFPRSNLFNGESLGGYDRQSVANVDIVSGCFLLIDHDLWRALSGFTPAFFMYGEEADLCLRALQLGASPMITPEATIVHHGGKSETARSDKIVKLLAAKTELSDRHMSAGPRAFTQAMLLLWPLTRWWGLSIAARLLAKPALGERAKVWREVYARRASWQQGYRHGRLSAPGRTTLGLATTAPR